MGWTFVCSHTIVPVFVMVSSVGPLTLAHPGAASQQQHGMVAERSKAPGSGTPELANVQDFLVSVMGREFESHPCHKPFAVWAVERGGGEGPLIFGPSRSFRSEAAGVGSGLGLQPSLGLRFVFARVWALGPAARDAHARNGLPPASLVMAGLTDRWWMAGRRSASETADP